MNQTDNHNKTSADTESMSAETATNPTNDPDSMRADAGKNSGSDNTRQTRKPRSLKVRAKAMISQLKEIEDDTKEKVVLDRADRGAKMIDKIDKHVAVLRAEAAGKPKVSQKKAAAVIREFNDLAEKIQGHLDTLEQGRLALTKDDLAILKG